ncbi:MAG: ATP-binding protein [Anaerolineae bacterium]
MENWRLPIIDLRRCTRCGLCVARCPTEAVEMQAQGPVIVRPDDCTFCTECEAVCPEHAIRCEFEITWAE